MALEVELVVEAVLPAVLLPVVALVVLFLQPPARLLRQAQLLRPGLLPVVAVRPVALPQEAEVAVVVLVRGLVASESLRSRQPFSASTARISPSPVQPTYGQAVSSR